MTKSFAYRELLHRLNSAIQPICQKANEELRALPPEALEELIHCYEEDLKLRTRRKKILTAIGLTVASFALIWGGISLWPSLSQGTAGYTGMPPVFTNATHMSQLHE